MGTAEKKRLATWHVSLLCPSRPLHHAQARAPATSSLLHRRRQRVCQPAADGDVLEVIALPPSPDERAHEALVARAALGRHRSASWSAPARVSAAWSGTSDTMQWTSR